VKRREAKESEDRLRFTTQEIVSLFGPDILINTVASFYATHRIEKYREEALKAQRS
jgi:hypothetical protein